MKWLTKTRKRRGYMILIQRNVNFQFLRFIEHCTADDILNGASAEQEDNSPQRIVVASPFTIKERYGKTILLAGSYISFMLP